MMYNVCCRTLFKLIEAMIGVQLAAGSRPSQLQGLRKILEWLTFTAGFSSTAKEEKMM